MKVKKGFPLDHKKVKAEDRRWLLDFWTNHSRWVLNLKFTLASLYISFISFMIATYAILISIEKGITDLVIFVGEIYAFLFVVVTIYYYTRLSFLKKHTSNADIKYKDVFKIHFNYAKRQKNKGNIR